MHPATRKTASSAFSKQDWDAVLKCTTLPILEETRSRLHSLLRDKQVTFNDLAPEIERDPALCLQIQRLAVQINPETLQQISGAANCLSLIGMQELVRLVKQLPVVTADSDDAGEQAYRSALITASMAGTLAAVLTQQKSNNSEHYARWAAVMVYAPLWPWLLQQPQAQNFFYYLGQGEESARAIQEVFGDDIKPWQQIVNRFAMPPLARDAWNPTKQPELKHWRLLLRHDPWDLDKETGRPLLHVCQKPELTPVLANALAWQLHISPASQRSQRWIRIISHWLSRSPDSLLPKLRETQLNTARLMRSAFSTGVHSWLSPQTMANSGLVYPWIGDSPAPHISRSGKSATDPGNTTTAASSADNHQAIAATTSAAPAPSEHERHQQAFTSLQNRMEQDAGSFGDWNHLMKELLQGIHEDLELPFAAVLLPNKEKSAIRMRYQRGLPEQHPLLGLQSRLQPANLFSKLMQRQAAIAVHSANRDNVLGGLAMDVAERLPSFFMAMSITAGNKPVGIVIAGISDLSQPLPGQLQYQQFKQLCHSASHGLAALKQLSTRQAPTQSPSTTASVTTDSH